MLRTEHNTLRLAIGIDVAAVRSSDDFGAAVEAWLRALHDDRPELFDKITGAMAKAKGSRPPASLRVVRGGCKEDGTEPAE